MKLYRFDPAAGMPIDAYDSSFVLARLARSDGTALRAACFHLEPGGQVGRHRATAGQLFCVVAGDGWVAGEDGERMAIGAQQAAWWDAGELHDAVARTAMTVIVVEGDNLAVEATSQRRTT
jgi:quercetin dioxygenase-like cupin family protein